MAETSAADAPVTSDIKPADLGAEAQEQAKPEPPTEAIGKEPGAKPQPEKKPAKPAAKKAVPRPRKQAAGSAADGDAEEQDEESPEPVKNLWCFRHGQVQPDTRFDIVLAATEAEALQKWLENRGIRQAPHGLQIVNKGEAEDDTVTG